MGNGETSTVAQLVFFENITQKGRQIPRNAAEMQELILSSGASVTLAASAPPSFTGVQIGGCLYVNGTDAISDYRRKKILAHEWFHWLRRPYIDDPLQIYCYSEHPHTRDIEEQYAKEFERLF